MPLILSTSTIGASTNYTAISVDSLGRINYPNQPSFFAYYSASTTISSGATMTFTTTDHNIGNCYSTSTGRFTAPIAGRYWFGWGGIAGSTNNTVYRMYLFKNGTYYNTSQASPWQVRMDNSASGSEYIPGFRCAIATLAVGDYIQVYYTADDGSSHGPWDYQSFMGYLLA